MAENTPINTIVDLGDVDLGDTSSSTMSNKTSDVYQYFTFKSSRYFCNYCSKNYADSATSTLRRHINKKHPNVIVRQEEKEKTTGEMDKYVNKSVENVSVIFI